MTDQEKLGFIHYYYGNGRGKTSTTIGTIMRALGHGFKPYLIQFLKLHDADKSHSGYFMGEINYLKDHIPIKQYGSFKFVNLRKPKEEDVKRGREGLEWSKKIINSGEYDLVVLDEIVDIVKLKMISIDELMEVLENKPPHVEVIVTGHFGYKKLLSIAHYITYFSLIHHPYYEGYKARKGIEF